MPGCVYNILSEQSLAREIKCQFRKILQSAGDKIISAPVAGWEPTTSHEPVYIPTADGESIAETIYVNVPAWRDPKTGTIYLDETGRAKLEAVKARYLGIRSPHQL
jgi:hypothetical protein